MDSRKINTYPESLEKIKSMNYRDMKLTLILLLSIEEEQTTKAINTILEN